MNKYSCSILNFLIVIFVFLFVSPSFIFVFMIPFMIWNTFVFPDDSLLFIGTIIISGVVLLFGIYLFIVVISFLSTNCRYVAIEKRNSKLVIGHRFRGRIEISNKSIEKIFVYYGAVVGGKGPSIKFANVKILTKDGEEFYLIISDYDEFCDELPKNIPTIVRNTGLFMPWKKVFDTFR